MKTIKTLVKEQINLEKSYINEHKEIVKMLKPLEGKQFNFRTFTAKNLKGFKFTSKYGMFYISGKYEHLIGYRENPSVNIENFKKFDACYGSAAEERINKLLNLDVKELQKISNKINKSFNELRYLFNDLEIENFDSYNNPIYYNMLRNIYAGEKSQRQEIELHKFYYIKKSRS